MVEPSVPSIFLVFLAGIVTILKPCCLPLVPAIFSGSAGHRLRPLSIVSGLTVSFTAMGVLVSAFGATFASFTDSLRSIAILFIIGMGAVLFDDDINMEFIKISSAITQGIRQYFGALSGYLLVIEHARRRSCRRLFTGHVSWYPLDPVRWTKSLAQCLRTSLLWGIFPTAHGCCLFILWA